MMSAEVRPVDVARLKQVLSEYVLVPQSESRWLVLLLVLLAVLTALVSVMLYTQRDKRGDKFRWYIVVWFLHCVLFGITGLNILVSLDGGGWIAIWLGAMVFSCIAVGYAFFPGRARWSSIIVLSLLIAMVVVSIMLPKARAFAEIQRLIFEKEARGLESLGPVLNPDGKESGIF